MIIKLAIAAVEKGADCLRINPGNIGSETKVREVVNICKERQVPIRIGCEFWVYKKEYLENIKVLMKTLWYIVP